MDTSAVPGNDVMIFTRTLKDVFFMNCSFLASANVRCVVSECVFPMYVVYLGALILALYRYAVHISIFYYDY